MRPRAEVVVAALLATVALALHLLFFRTAGVLWRDEVGSLNLARAPWRVLWAGLQFESFPLVWPLLLRAWTGGLGAGLTSVRVLGLLTGASVVAATWMAMRTFGSRSPAIALAIGGLSAAVIRYGDSIRAYGWSVVAGLLALAAMYGAAKTQTSRAWLLAAIASVVSVHTSFFNAALLFAACVAAASIAGSIRATLKPLAIGFLAAVSLLVYIPMVEGRARWTSIEVLGVDVRWIVNQMVAAFSTSGALTALVILVVTAGALVTGFRAGDERSRFLIITLVLMFAGELVILRQLSYAPEPWYFVLLIAVTAACVDGLLAGSAPMVRVGVAVIIAALSLPPAIRYVSMHATNVDAVAAALRKYEKRGDVAVIYPWYCGVSFRAQVKEGWTTLPPLEDYSWHRYDLLKPLLGRREVVQPLLEAVTRSLRSGHSVWLAGFPLCSQSVPLLSDPRTSTPAVRSDAMWCTALRETLLANANRGAIVVPSDPDAIPYERLQLVVFTRQEQGIDPQAERGSKLLSSQ